MNLNLVQFDSIPEISSVSKELGDDGVIVAMDFSEQELKEFNSKKRKSDAKLFSCKIFNKRDDNAFRKFSKLADFTCVRGASMEMNAWAAKRKADFLLQPFGAGKNFFDLATANVLRDSNVFTAILFNEFLEARGFRQTQLMKNAMLCVKLLEKAKAGTLFVSGAREKEGMRSSKDLASFASMLGAKKQGARERKENFEKILERVE